MSFYIIVEGSVKDCMVAVSTCTTVIAHDMYIVKPCQWYDTHLYNPGNHNIVK